MRNIILTILCVFSWFLFIPQCLANINFDVTPIKYELEADPGDSITLPATFINRGTGTFTITTGASDFEPTGNTGQPKFVRYSELVNPDQQLSSWITIDIPSFTTTPGNRDTVNFTIDVPSDATPGGHYGAVFFKNNSLVSGSGNIGFNVDYGILVLVNVSGEIVSTGSVDNISIGGGSGGYDRCGPEGDKSGNSYDGKCEGDNKPIIVNDNIDKCIIDFTPSNFDGKCFENPLANNNDTSQDINLDNEGQDETVNNGDNNTFNVNFDIPFKNDGNTHIKPNGNIVIKDENGKIIKKIGEKLIKNEKGAIIGKEIVDYLPINDEEGNVLPNSTRVFDYEWRGFPYRDLNGDIAYRKPGEYYTLKNQRESGFLMFWERVSTQKQYKDLTADIDLSYVNHLGERIEFNSAKDFQIEYIEQYIGINPYVVLPIVIIGFLLLLIYSYNLAFKRKVCINKDCGKKIKSKLKVCPYCVAIQDKKKFKTQKNITKKKSKKIKKK